MMDRTIVLMLVGTLVGGAFGWLVAPFPGVQLFDAWLGASVGCNVMLLVAETDLAIRR